MHEQCVLGSLFSSPVQEPGNENTSIYFVLVHTQNKDDAALTKFTCRLTCVEYHSKLGVINMPLLSWPAFYGKLFMQFI